jgi:hypothetical protein
VPVRRLACAIVAAATGALAACPAPDPCEGIPTCVNIRVDGLLIDAIDQLELDLVYAGIHDTLTIGQVGRDVELPIAIPLTIDLPSVSQIAVDVVAAGRRAGSVVGLDFGSTSVLQGFDSDLSLSLFPGTQCTEGAVYCGGTGTVIAESQSLYRCAQGVPIFYARCTTSCSPHFSAPAACVGLGSCRDGGSYCGGHVLDGDPNTLYICSHFEGTSPTPCPAGCAVADDGQDSCR